MYTQMDRIIRSQSLWRVLPLINIFVSEWQVWRKEQAQPRYRLVSIEHDVSGLPPYPLDMSPLMALPFGTLDKLGVPYNSPIHTTPAAYHPTTIAQYALAHWNTYLATKCEKNRQAFMIQARWLVEHELRLADDTAGWPIPFPSLTYNALTPWLSALTQGNCISVLVRAYCLSNDIVFLQVARRAVRTFELDIQDGGVRTSIGDNGIFFEEVAAYPAAHILNGYILGLFGLYDYVALTDDAQTTRLIQRSLVTLHTFIDEFDTGYWSCYDLLFKRLASPFYHALHVTLLEALAQYSGCEHCMALATKWAEYQHSRNAYIRYFVISRVTRYYRGLKRVLFNMLSMKK